MGILTVHALVLFICIHLAHAMVTKEVPLSVGAPSSGIIDQNIVMIHPISQLSAPFLRIRSEANATIDETLFFTLRGQRRQFSWQLPHGTTVGGISRFSKTLCVKEEKLSLLVTTSSKRPISYTVLPLGFHQRNISLNVNETVRVLPQEAHISTFYIPPQLDLVWLTLESDQETLANVTLVPDSCENGEVTGLKHGIYQTMTTKAAFAVQRSLLPAFDLIIEVPHQDIVPRGNIQEEDHKLIEKPIHFYIIPNTSSWVSALLWFTIAAGTLGLSVLGLFWFPVGQRWLRYPKKDPPNFKLLRGLSMRRGGTVSGSFVYNLLIIAAFYMLPAIQLLFSYYENYHNSGNEDQCYYNFYCANPWGPFVAFNNIYSNAAYVILGVIFLMIVRHHSRNMNWRFAEIFYAMGTALILEGFLSAGYHICPTGTNFQFDTTFMYLISGLCMYHLYQIRNPEAEERPYEFYGIYAAAVAFVVICISTSRNWQWRILLAVFYSSLAFTICYLSSIKMYFSNEAGRNCPRCRWWMGTVQTWINYGFILYSTWQIFVNPAQFPSVLLNLFITNLFLFTAFYFAVKILNGELIVLAPKVCAVASAISWVVSLYFFNIRVTDWQLTPAESRSLNHSCIFLDFFDAHDVWHLLSAFSLFTSFLLLLTLDDGQDMAEFDAGVAEVEDALDAASSMLSKLDRKDHQVAPGTKTKQS